MKRSDPNGGVCLCMGVTKSMDHQNIQTVRVVAAVVENNGRYLITQRRPTAVLPLMWEFPGGRVEPGETDTAALQREVRHRLGV
ncbi:MAG TPA: NUDIX domain-containing protein, partial [Polyangiaceae bacterium]|nr:NUDIX domain-containing protein [Polyangiaceae bacterium]